MQTDGTSRVQWIADFRRISAQQPCVLVTLILVSGSAPRESGCRMVVSPDEVAGSIGGGNLEFKAIELARELIENAGPGTQHRKLYGLGPELNQCCGGAVALHYEVFAGGVPGWVDDASKALESGASAVLLSALDLPVSRKWVVTDLTRNQDDLPQQVIDAAAALMQATGRQSGGLRVETGHGDWWLENVQAGLKPLVLFGAGHVGQAVATVLAPLPFDVTWVDSRKGVFPDQTPRHIRTEYSENPVAWAARAGSDSIFVVMTHSHQLDEEICFEILRRNEFAWLGLIGSDTKRRRFVHRLEQLGIPASRLNRLVCPIGLSGIGGKQPATIALSLAAQLMTDHEG